MINNSIAARLLFYFTITGALVFGLLLAFFFLLSNNFANLAIKDSLRGMTEDMEQAFFIDASGQLALDDSDIMLKWGYDALYSNLGFRLLNHDDYDTVMISNAGQQKNNLIRKIPTAIPLGYSHIEGLESDIYRKEISIAGKFYFLDVARSDLLGRLANEAVKPAIWEVSVTTVMMALLVFLIVSTIAIRMIVRPVRSVTKQLSGISPEHLHKRLDTSHLPNELLPISNALNDALERVEKGFYEQKRFVANAAHELRTPLTILRNRVELKVSQPGLRNEIVHDVDYMSRIVEQLLDLSRAQNNSTYDFTDISLNDIARDACLLLAPLAIDNAKDLELVETDAKDIVKGDKGSLVVVLKNLIENAIKHTPAHSSIKVTVSKNEIAVADSGTGISEGDRKNIFERFWRKNQSDLSGSGLGLSIIKEIIVFHGATIIVQKSLDLGGAEFRIRFDAP